MNFTKLSVGSRDVIKPAEEGWLNIDIEPLAKHRANFLQMDVFDMPLEWQNKFEHVEAVHVLEHINRNKRQDFVNMLYWATKPGGHCYIEVPNFPAIVANLHEAYLKDDQHAQHIWTTSIYGKQRSPGDQHCWGFNHSTLSELFRTAGFYQIDYCLNGPGTSQLGLRVPMISTHWRAEPILLVRGNKPSRGGKV